MADDVQANIGLNIDTSKALSGLKALQSELSALHTQLSKLGPTQRAQAAGVHRSLIDNINATGKFAASMTTVKTTAESFTHALEKNKLTMGEYFRYAGGASKSFGKNFAREFATIEKVASVRVALVFRVLTFKLDPVEPLYCVKPVEFLSVATFSSIWDGLAE